MRFIAFLTLVPTALALLAASPADAGQTWTTLATTRSSTTADEGATFTARVHGSDAALPTGTVDFVRIQSWGASSLASVTPERDFDAGVIATEIDHTCAVTTTGSVMCWGPNGSGQLGDGTTETRTTPVTVVGLPQSVVAVAPGYQHTCAVTLGGDVYCWGLNEDGQLGEGGSLAYSATPVRAHLNGVRALGLASGSRHSCALLENGAVQCWGKFALGFVGPGFPHAIYEPSAISGLDRDVVSVSAGGDFTCALTSAGAVRCLGSNNFGQLGNGSTSTYGTLATVSGLDDDMTAVSAGSNFACALTKGGAVVCWGNNDWGQLGDGTTTTRTTPVAVLGLDSGAIAISAGGFHACALLSSGETRCWGNDTRGQLGDGTTAAIRTTPVTASVLTGDVVGIAAGSLHTCVALADGSARCFGLNALNSLGDGTSTDSFAAVAPVGAEVRPVAKAVYAGVTRWNGPASVQARYRTEAGVPLSNSSGTSVTVTPTVWLVLLPPGQAVYYGEDLTLSAAVADQNGPLDGGTVEFWDDLGQSLGTAAVVDGRAELTVVATQRGHRRYTAVYENAAAGIYDVQTAPLSVTIYLQVSTTLSVSDPAPEVGDPVTLRADLASLEMVSGSVVFFDAETMQSVGTAAIESGSASLVLTGLALGTHRFVAQPFLPQEIDAGGGDSNVVTVTVRPAVSAPPSPTSTSLTSSSSGTTVVGEPVTFTARVTSTGGTPSGTVTFRDGDVGTILGTSALAGGTASLAVSDLPLGATHVVADYAGNDAFEASSGSVLHVVRQAATSVTLTASAGATLFGRPVTFTARVTSPEGAPDGTVTFRADTVGTLGTVALVGGTASLTVSTLPEGVTTVIADYGGTYLFETSTQTVQHVVGQAETSLALTDSAGTTLFGRPVTFTARVTSPDGTPDGTVTFGAGAVGILGTVDLVDGTATLTVTTLPQGTTGVYAEYAGTDLFATSYAELQHVVVQATTTTALTASTDTSLVGRPVTFTARVTSPDGTPDGTVTFSSDNVGTLDTVDLVDGTATLTVTTLPQGTAGVYADYAGTDFYGTSYGSLQHAVIQATTTTAVTASTDTTLVGRPVTFTARVTSPDGTPDGSVTFSSDNVGTLGTVDLVDGTATLTVTTLPQGTAGIYVEYAGTDFYGTSYGSLLHVVNKAQTTLALSASPGQVLVGQEVTIQATVSSPDGFVGGSVTFYDEFGATAGVVALVDQAASFTFRPQEEGTQSFYAVYEGSDFFEDDDASVAVQVGKAATTMVVTGSVSTATVGDSVTVTATLASPAGTPDGTVTFFADDGSAHPVTLVAGTASFTFDTLEEGSADIYVQYEGNGFFDYADGYVSVAVTRVATTIALETSPSPSVYGQPVTVTATVASAKGTPDGSVVFSDPYSNEITVALVDGVATATIDDLPAGTPFINAEYGGTLRFESATTYLLQDVSPAPTTLSVTTSKSPSKVGEEVTFTATVTSEAGAPDGTVAFTDENGSAVGDYSADLIDGVATVTASDLSAGEHVVTATYVPARGNFDASVGTVAQTVEDIAVQVSLSASATRTVRFEPLTLTATLVADGDLPDGEVTFHAGDAVLGTERGVDGVAAIETDELPVGRSEIKAVFQADSGSDPVESAVTTVTVDKRAPEIAISVSADPPRVGEEVTITATVQAGLDAAPQPTGSVRFEAAGAVLGTEPLSDGEASLTWTPSAAGPVEIIAAYEGDDDYTGPSASSIVSVAETFVDDGLADLLVIKAGPTSAGGVHFADNLLATPGSASVFRDLGSVLNVVPGDGRVVASARGDFNDDGYLDIALARPNAVEIWFNDGNAHFERGVVHDVIGFALSLTPGDVDNDGDVDLVVVLPGPKQILLLRNQLTTPDETLTAELLPWPGAFIGVPNIALGDADGDGDVDLIAFGILTDNLRSGAQTLLNDGTGTFSAGPAPDGVAGTFSGAFAVGDVDADGSLDVVAAMDSRPPRVFRNDGTAAFRPAGSVGDVAATVSGLTDVDADGDLDVVTAADGSVRVLLNEGAGGFVPGSTIDGGPLAVRAADLNGDLADDVVILGRGGLVRAFVNAGGGDFSDAGSFRPDLEAPSDLMPGEYRTANARANDQPTVLAIDVPGDLLTDQPFVVAVRATGVPQVPEGTVTLFVDGEEAASADLDAGAAAIRIAGLDLGTREIRAEYNPAPGFRASTSAGVTREVVDPNRAPVFGDTTATLVTEEDSAGSVTVSASDPDGDPLTYDAVVDPLHGSLSRTAANQFGYRPVTGFVGTDGFRIRASDGRGGEDTLDVIVTVTPIVPSPTTAALSVSPSPSVVGQSVTFTAAITSTSGIPTGRVVFTRGETDLGSAELDRTGRGSVTVSTLPVGTTTITASYEGVKRYRGSSTSLSHVVTLAGSAVTLAAAPTSSTYGGSVTLTATVSETAGLGLTPSGTVTFKDGADSLGTATLSAGKATLTTSAIAAGTRTLSASYAGSDRHAPSSAAGRTFVVSPAASTATVAVSTAAPVFGQSVTVTVTVAGPGDKPTGTATFKDGAATLGTATVTAGTATLTTSALGIGTHDITVAYGGSAAHKASTGGPATVVVKAARTGVVLTASANPVTFGASVKLTARVTPETAAAGTVPAGTVTFKDGAATLGTATLSGGVADLTTTALPGGTRSLTAVYGGTAQHLASTSAALAQTVSPASSTTALTASAATAVFGEPVVLQVSVSSAAGTPAGPVTVFDGTEAIGTATLDTAGKATVRAGSLGVGTHSLKAGYAASANHAASDSSAVSVKVDKAATFVTVVSSRNPSAAGASVTFTATVAPAAPAVTGVPEGSIVFKEGLTVLETVALKDGVATFKTTRLEPGAHPIRAVYDATGPHKDGASATLNQIVQAATTRTALVVTPTATDVGETVTLTATVTVPSGGTPTGTVTFFDGTEAIGTDDLAKGVATLKTTALSAGDHSLTARYGGSTDHEPSTSTATTVKIAPIGVTLTVASSENPSVPGQAVTFTATAAAERGSARPTGTVTFFDGSKALGTAPLKLGKATFEAAKLASGNRSISASLEATGNFADATSAVLVQAVRKAATTTAIAIPKETIRPGESLTVSVTVKTAQSGVDAVDGSVVIRDGTTTLATRALVDGKASLPVADFDTGVHVLSASYRGSTGFLDSASSSVTVTVDGRTGGETIANTTKAGAQVTPVAVPTDAGAYAVYWASNGQDGSGYGIYGRRFAATGAAAGAEVRVNTTTAGSQTAPSAARLTSGASVVVWRSEGQDGDGGGVYGQVFSSAGTASGKEFRVNTATAGDQSAPTVAALTNGRFAVAYTSTAVINADKGVIVRPYSSSGIAQSEIRVDALTTGAADEPALAGLPDGGFVVVYSVTGSSAANNGIRLQRFSSTGAKVGSLLKVPNNTSAQKREPVVAALDGGGFVVAWTSDGQDGSGDGVYARRFSASGVAAAAEFAVPQGFKGDQSEPVLAAFPGGGFVIAYTSASEDGNLGGIYLRRFTKAGTGADIAIRANATTKGNQHRPAVTTLTDRAFAVQWTSDLQDGSAGGIYGQLYTLGGPASEW